MKILTVVGARPQFIKAAMLSRAIAQHNSKFDDQINEVIVHTGQHFDSNMSDVFFLELGIPEPKYHLGISSLSHGAMTGRMLEKIETVLVSEKPDKLLVYGDTNSTLAGSLAASKLAIPVIHVEAGLRSNNMAMPEEVNRILTDKVSSLLFCPTKVAVDNLKREGVTDGVYFSGDVMYDAMSVFLEISQNRYNLNRWNIEQKQYALCTLHRAENTNNLEKLFSIFEALRKISKQIKIVMPIHPRTLQILTQNGKTNWLKAINVLEPVSYLEMIRLEASAAIILTDSGGVQKEAFFNQVPCITLREETEWVETVRLGWNYVAGASTQKILDAFFELKNGLTTPTEKPYGDSNAAQFIVKKMMESI